MKDHTNHFTFIMAFITLLLLSTTLEPFQSLAKAGSLCSEILTAESPAKGLSASQIEKIATHPWNESFKEFGLGENLAFTSMHFTESPPDTLYKGEYFQSQFLIRILRQRFPEAQFASSTEQVAPGRKEVKIVIADLAEKFAGNVFRIDALIDSGLVLPMHLLKAANSTRVAIPKDEARARIGLAKERKVVSLYVRSQDTLTNINQLYPTTEFHRLLGAIQEGFQYDTLIVTFGNQTRGMSFHNSGVLAPGLAWDTVLPLSSLPFRAATELDGQVLVMNDTVGKMIDIYAAADLAVIVGPVNFIEPLRVGTPTLLFEKRNSESPRSDYGAYDSDILNRIAEMAMTTGLLRRASYKRLEDNYTQFGPLLRELQSAHDTGADLSATAIQPLLDALEKHLDYQIHRYDRMDYLRNGL